MKVCNTCHKPLALSNFYQQRIDSKIYYKSDCKVCSRLKHKKWYNLNKEHIKNYAKNYNQQEKAKIKNRERANKFRNNSLNKISIQNYREQYRKDNKNYFKLYTIKYRKINKVKLKRQRHLYYLDNKSKILKKHNEYSKRTRIYSWRTTFKYEKWRDKIYKNGNYTCQMCGKQHCKLNAHHIKPAKQYPELRYVVENGMCLCIKCHTTIHNTIYH